MSSKDELSFEIIELYKKKNCKKCHGRGYIIQDLTIGHKPIGTAQLIRYGDYCTCVRNNLKRNKV